jgi:murein L,D-transpeptidase YcbB/YkuD
LQVQALATIVGQSPSRAYGLIAGTGCIFGDEVSRMSSLRRGVSPLNATLALAAVAGIAALPLAATSAPAAAASAAAASGEVAAFYQARGGVPLWFSPNAGNAAQQLIGLLSTAQVDRLNPKRYNVKGLTRALADARSGNPAAIQRADAMFSQALVAYASDQRHDPGIGILYVDCARKP